MRCYLNGHGLYCDPNTLEHKLETYYLIPYALKKSIKLSSLKQTCKSEPSGGFACPLSMKRNYLIWRYLYCYPNTLQHKLKMFFLILYKHSMKMSLQLGCFKETRESTSPKIVETDANSHKNLLYYTNNTIIKRVFGPLKNCFQCPTCSTGPELNNSELHNLMNSIRDQKKEARSRN